MAVKVVTSKILVKTKGEDDILDITSRIDQNLKESKMMNGNITIFVSGSTAAITTIEFEPGLCEDFPRMLQRVAPSNIAYNHEKMWHDGNGRSHVKASLIGPSLTVPFSNGKMMIGTWQQIVLIEFDIRSRNRTIVTQIIGE